jgi:L,D-transpeptidase catalytic domain
MWATTAVAVSIVLAAATVVGVASTAPSPAATVPLGTPTHPYTPGISPPRLVVPKVLPLAQRQTWRWAEVRRPVAARRRPGGKLAARLRTRTPEHTVNIVLVTKTAVHRGRLWARVRLPVLPNDTQGWVPRAALSGYTFVDTHLVVSLRHRRMTLFRAGRAIFRAPVGIGAPGTPTPRGQFYIRDRLRGYASAFYGPIAFGTSARSAVLTEWPAGGFIGIHGTNAPRLIPGRPSHGCIRMRNRDLLRLARLLPVGTPVTIE